MQPKAANDNTPQRRPAWFDDLLIAHEPYIRSRIASMEKTISKHDDIYQDVVTRALETWSAYRADGNFAGWLYWIVFKTVNKKDKSAAHGPAYRAAEPNQEYAADLARAVEIMPTEVVLSAFGHSEASIGARLGLTGPAIHYRIAHARAKVVNDNEPKKRAA